MSKLADIIDDDYQINYAKLEELLIADYGNKEKANAIYKECEANQPTKKEERSLYFYKCLVSKSLNAQKV